MNINILLPEREYFSMREVCKITNLQSYVLRYWEKEFKFALSPRRRNSNQRKYTKDDIYTILKIKKLRYEDKFTISGVKQYLWKERLKKNKMATQPDIFEIPRSIELLRDIKKDLQEILEILK